MNRVPLENGSQPSLLLVAPYFFPQNIGGAPRLFDMLLSNISKYKATAFASDAGKSVSAINQFDQEILRMRKYRVMRGSLTDLSIPAGCGVFEKIIRTVKWLLEQRASILKILSHTQPRVIVSGNTYRCGWLWNRLHRKYIKVNFIHGEELTMNSGSGPLSKWLRREQIKALQNAHLNIAVSRYSAEKIVACSNADVRRIVVLPNAVDTSRFRPCADRDATRKRLNWDNHTVLITIARLVERKGIDQVLRALAAATNLPDDWIYVVAGKGPCEESLKALALELGVSPRVHFYGYVDDSRLPDLYGAADVFVQTNRCVDGDTEGFGIVFLEASACGTPVIGGIAGGTADAIEDGVSGLRVDGEDVQAITQAISALCSSPDLGKRMAEQGLARVRNLFSAQSHARRFEALIDQVSGHPR